MKIISSLACRFSPLPLAFLLLTAGCSEEPGLPTNPEPLGENWRMFFNHIHTVHSEDNMEWQVVKSSVANVIGRANDIATASGTNAAIAITDHRTVAALFDPEFAPIGNAIPIIGEEWGGKGHAGVIGFSGNTKITDGDGPDDYEAMITEAHARGGIVIANHPGNWHSDRALDIDAIEVLHSPFWGDGNYTTLDWWQRLLVAGEQITAVAGADSHFFFHPIQTALNLVNAPSNSQEDMLNAVEAGRVLIVVSPAASRVLLTADLDNDGDYSDAMVGDKFAVSASQTVAFEARLEGSKPFQTLKLIDRNGTFYEETIKSGSGWDGSTYRFTRTFSPNEKNFVRAELISSLEALDQVGPECVTNPIYAVGTQTSPYTEATLQGTVTLAGQPVGGVLLEAKPGRDSKTTTNPDGSYSLILPHHANYTMKVQLTPDSEVQYIDGAAMSDEDITFDIAL